MKSTGIIRKVDDLGRVVIPKEIRSIYGLDIGEPLEIFVDQDIIILKKYSPGCLFCNSVDKSNMVNFSSYMICNDCLLKLKNAKNL